MAIGDLYSASYAPIYRRIFIEHPQWRAKHQRNLEILRSLLSPESRWLDLLCGQAWHFSQLPEVGSRTGVDASAAQLAFARRECPAATFIEADVLSCDLEAASFDVVTSFWGSYSYLDDPDRIARFVARMIEWTAPGGAVYLELITPETLLAFNRIAFAAETGSATELRSADATRWSFRDPAGVHRLTSPPIAFFRELLAPHFAVVELRGSVSTMKQLVARERR